MAAARGPVVDVACGRGRNALALARRGIPVLGLDRSEPFLRELAGSARSHGWPVAVARCDLEAEAGAPLAAQSCAALLVFRFLFRPLAAQLVEALVPGGLLLYETFTIHQRDLSHGPGNPAFLLEDDELPRLFAALRVIDHWEGVRPGDPTAAVACLAAEKPR